MFANPREIINLLTDLENKTIADFGSGAGEYTLAIADKIAQSKGKGRIYALDVQLDLLNRLKKIAEKNNLSEIIFTVWTDLENPGATKLPAQSLDVGIIANVLFQIEDKQAFITEVKRLLKPGGEILVVDWEDSFSGLGPSPEHLFPKEEALHLLEDNGFNVLGLHEHSDHHYILTARQL